MASNLEILGSISSHPSAVAGKDFVYILETDNHLYLKNTTGQWDLTETLSAIAHNDTTSKQGGGGSEFYHLTAAQHTKATQIATAVLDGLLSAANYTLFNAKMPNPFTANGDLLTRIAGVPARVGVGSEGDIWTVVSGAPAWAAAGASGLPTGYVQGLQAEWVSDTTLRVTPGKCRSDDDTFDMVLGSNRDAVITASGAGGLDTGSESSSTGYYLWLIYDSTGETYAAMLSESATSPTMPGDYDKKRLIGYSFNNSSSNLLEFKMYGDGCTRFVHYNEPRQTVQRLLDGGTSTIWADVDCSDLVPANAISIMVHMQHSTSGLGYIRPNAMSSLTGGSTFCFAGNENTVEIGIDDQTVEYDTSGGSLTLDLTGYRVLI